MKKHHLFSLLLSAVALLYGWDYNCTFTEGQWNANDWMLVASPRWTYEGTWVQKDGHIENAVPAGVTADILQRKRADETYSSMVLTHKLTGKAVISTTLLFEYQMAPLIVLAGPLTQEKGKMPRYAEHWEIVLYNKGINVWHHEIREGKPYYRKAAYLYADFLPNVKYELIARITPKGKVPMLEISCNGHTFGCMLPSFPKEYYAGITGCEGINHFYDFKVKEN